ncbi:flavodoxin-dependent (E)-4-hydroxy-3-methylbut-2-enyl-diphosphate synthase [Candidatus Peregrinibacteria bacterium]|nr:flavodoxin-dependent (E)-4-hydroxy-3-methylbut-2-enyl-diphosphate synthase [Candidatus Peregrinibacteria bacterium]
MRLNTPVVNIRGVKIGGNNPIAVQSMTNTDTADASATAKQCIELADAGSELVRITVNNEASIKAVPEIRKILDKKGYKNLPLIGDFHFNGHKLFKNFPDCAKFLDKYRINPGNIGFGKEHDKNFKKIINTAIKNKKPVRIGINWGSIDKNLLAELMKKNFGKKKPKSDREVIIDTMIESALNSAKFAEKLGLPQNFIILSIKISVVQDMIEAYEKLVKRMTKDNHFYALHIGLTEAGSGMQGIISSSAALAILLQKGIGDTIRISLTPEPGQSRTREVEACKTILQSLGSRYFRPKITSCPGCGRTDSDFFQKLTKEIKGHINKNLKIWEKKYPRISEMKIAVMGCAVNGPGESRHADIAISLPGKSEQKVAPVFIKGKFKKNLKGKNIPQDFIKIIENFIEEKYGI